MAHTAPPPPPAAAAKAVRVRFDRFELDEENASLTCDGKPIALPPTPFAVLCTLVRRQGTLVTKNDLLDAVWGHRFVTESVLKTVIGKLRTALQDDARQPRFIETVSRRGYRFIASTVAAPRAGPMRAVETDTTASDTFIGREEALAQLHAVWDRACAGKRAIVWVAGDPGIGKTTLIDHFVASLGDVACVRGQCVDQYGAGEPYLPVLEALNELCRRDSSAAAMLRSIAPAWLAQLPWLTTAEERDTLRRELASMTGDRMLRELAEFLDRYAERTPLLVLTEDLHWSDRATVRLLDYLSRRRTSARVMWLASFRLSEVIALDHPLNPLRRELRLHGLCEEIVLDPFSESEVSRYVAQKSSSIGADEAFVRLLHERTDGVPLFVSHVISDVLAGIARGGQDGAAADYVAKLAVPENLAAIIDHYIARLSSEQRSMLSAAAVRGADFRVSTVAEALGSDAAIVAQACEELVREQLWLTGSRAEPVASHPAYSFRHELFRQVLYERVSPVARAQLHRKLGLALEHERQAGVPVTAAELAMHFEHSGNAMPAARYYVEAAESALLQFSAADAVTLAERGLTLLGRVAPAPERDEAEVSLATVAGMAAAHMHGVSSSETKAALGRAEAALARIPAHRMRAPLLHLLALGLCIRADYAEALALAQRTLALASANDDAVFLRAACLIHGEVHMLQGRPRLAREWVERGIASADPQGASETDAGMDPQVTMLGVLGLELLHFGEVEAARAIFARAHKAADRSGQPMAQLIAIWLDALHEVRLGDVKRVDALARQMETLVKKYTLAQGRGAARWFRGWALSRSGEPRKGCDLIRDAYAENTRTGMLAGGSEVIGYAAEALLLEGDVEGAREQLAEALSIAEKLDERIYLPQLGIIEASIARALGKVKDADDSLRRALAEARAQEAPYLELLCLLELCDAPNAPATDRKALAALIERLPEAKDTQAVRRARTLLAKR